MHPKVNCYNYLWFSPKNDNFRLKTQILKCLKIHPTDEASFVIPVHSGFSKHSFFASSNDEESESVGEPEEEPKNHVFLITWPLCLESKNKEL